jgi:preprotein translocase subunit SecF
MTTNACIEACKADCRSRHGALMFGARRRCINACKADCAQQVSEAEALVFEQNVQAQIAAAEADARMREQLFRALRWILLFAVVAFVIYLFLRYRKNLGLDKAASGVKETIETIAT